LDIIMSWFGGCNKCSRWVLMLEVSATLLGKSSRKFTDVFTPAFNKVPGKAGWLCCWLLISWPDLNTFLEVVSDICKVAEAWCVWAVLSCVPSAVKLLRTNEEKSPADWMLSQAPVTLRALG
jgi:hypothetical protein